MPKFDVPRLSTIDPVSWAYKYRKVNGQPLDHRVQPYLVEPLLKAAQSMEPGYRGIDIALLKGRQAGGTTALITFGLWHLDVHGGEVIHAVVTEAQASNFNATILTPSIDTTEFSSLEPSDKVFNRRVKSFTGRPKAIYMLGHTLGGNSTSEGDFFRGETAEVILLDERGQMPERACAIIESCSDTVRTPVVWNIGSAGYRGDALDRVFTGGTRAEWAIRCNTCKKHTVLSPYGSTVDAVERCYGKIADEYKYLCEHCGKAIDTANGEWVHNNGPYPSYHVSSMNSAFFDAYKLHKRLQNPNSTDESILREIAGLPHGGEGVAIAPEEIKFENISKKAKNSIMAVDWGTESSWLTIKWDDEKVYVAATGRVQGDHDSHVKKLYEVAQSYSPFYIAADAGFNGGRNDKLNDLSGCTWSVISSLAPRPGNVLQQVQRDRQTRSYRIVRTWVWERIVADLRSGKLVLAPGLQELRNDILNVHPESAGRASREWTSYEMTKQHLAACLTYAMAVYYREATKQQTSIGKGSPIYA